jgi:hypothetical protein
MKKIKTITAALDRNEYLWKIVFLSGTFVLFFGWGMNSSNYSLFPLWKTISHMIQIGGCVILLPLGVRNVIRLLKQRSTRKTIAYMILGIATMIPVVVAKNKSAAYSFLLIICSLSIPFSFSVKTILASQATSLAFVVISFCAGIISETTIGRDLIVRHSLGTISPNYLMLSVFCIIAGVLIISRSISMRFRLIIGALSLASLILVFLLTDSRMGFVAGVAIVALYLIQTSRLLSVIVKRLKIITLFLPTLLIMATIIITILYSAGFFVRLNGLLSNRLELNKKGFEEWGVTLFGKDIEYIGQTYESDIPEGYNYIDSAYLNVLFESGVLYLLALLAYLWYVTRKIYNSGESYLILLLIVYEIYALFDGCLFGVSTNVLLLYNTGRELQSHYKKH